MSIKILFYYKAINLLIRVAFFPLTMGNHVFVGERAIVNAALVGSYVYIGKNAIIVRTIIQCVKVYKQVLSIYCIYLIVGQAIGLKRLLLHRRRCGRATWNYRAVFHSFRWQSSDICRRVAWVHAGSHGRFHEELLRTFFTGASLSDTHTVVYSQKVCSFQQCIILKVILSLVKYNQLLEWEREERKKFRKNQSYVRKYSWKEWI